MSSVQINTPFNVKVDAQQAGVGWRSLAFFLDLLFIWFYLWAVSYVFFDFLGMDWAVF